MVKDTNVRVFITLSKNQLERLEKYAEDTGLSKSIIVQIALNKEFINEDIKRVFSTDKSDTHVFHVKH